MAEIQMLMGLPASGKSTYARHLVRKNGNWVRINFDDLRSMLNDGVWSRGREKFVQKTAYDMVINALEQGKSVIWDNTSFAPKHKARLEEIARKHSVKFSVNYFHVEPEEAIKRDLARPTSVGAQVIWDMYYRYVWEAPKAEDRSDLPDAVILDMDGTLAFNDGHRGWYQWDKVGGDTPVNHICELARMYEKAGYAVLVVTGRDGSCINITDQWLKDHNVPFHDLFSRAEGDMRPDTVIKKEIYDEHIRGHYNVHLVIDDRESVVKMWGDQLGLRVLQARAPGQATDF